MHTYTKRRSCCARRDASDDIFLNVSEVYDTTETLLTRKKIESKARREICIALD